MRDRFRRGRFGPQDMVDKPDYALVGVVRIPELETSPARAIGRRVLWALAALLLCSVIVYLDRNGYRDVKDQPLSYLDSLYYSAVTLSTTGYGDITPISESARLINILFITPLRVLFLIVLIGTTLEVLTERSRQAIKIQNWRNRVRNHTIIVGYGTKGRTATTAVLADGVRPSEVVVVDDHHPALEAAAADGLVTVRGDATKSDILRLAGMQHAAALVIAANRDDTAVMVTLTARELNPRAKIVASIRESENTHLMRQSGANSVVVSSETAGRLLGIATITPSVVEVVEDLLSPEEGYAIAEREVDPSEVGGSPAHTKDLVLGVVRDGHLYRVGEADVEGIEIGDRLLYVRKGERG
ncbi:MAG: potassium channel family protein [Gordonia sp. (in: high G+C Gram-positive bacteria)]|uniref:potassium channel family protein n=1 Tax=Gordonia sp. (in: high G+C Gram-positive bacteria) TaxID=84139 RepID=UPI003BB6D4EA